MLRSAAVLLLSLLVPLAASAAPTALTDQQMDYITAGHNYHHKYNLKLFGGTHFYLKGKKTFKESKFVQKNWDIGKYADLAAGVAYGKGVALGSKYGKGPYARSKSFVGVKPYKGKVVSFKHGAKEIYGRKGRFIAWTASAAYKVVVGFNKYFHKLNRWEQRKALKVIKHVAHKKAAQAKTIAASHLRPPPILHKLKVR